MVADSGSIEELAKTPLLLWVGIGESTQIADSGSGQMCTFDLIWNPTHTSQSQFRATPKVDKRQYKVPPRIGPKTVRYFTFRNYYHFWPGMELESRLESRVPGSSESGIWPAPDSVSELVVALRTQSKSAISRTQESIGTGSEAENKGKEASRK